MEKQIKQDEKSAQEFLGLLSLDLTKTLTVKCYGEDEDFNRVLSKYAAG